MSRASEVRVYYLIIPNPLKLTHHSVNCLFLFKRKPSKFQKSRNLVAGGIVKNNSAKTDKQSTHPWHSLHRNNHVWWIQKGSIFFIFFFLQDTVRSYAWNAWMLVPLAPGRHFFHNIFFRWLPLEVKSIISLYGISIYLSFYLSTYIWAYLCIYIVFNINKYTHIYNKTTPCVHQGKQHHFESLLGPSFTKIKRFSCQPSHQHTAWIFDARLERRWKSSWKAAKSSCASGVLSYGKFGHPGVLQTFGGKFSLPHLLHVWNSSLHLP